MLFLISLLDFYYEIMILLMHNLLKYHKQKHELKTLLSKILSKNLTSFLHKTKKVIKKLFSFWIITKFIKLKKEKKT